MRWPTPAAALTLSRLSEPLIEPEIVFKLAKAPEPGMDEAALIGCVEWFAHGFEIVQSPFPGWRFAAADAVAAGGMHGAFLIGAPASHRGHRIRRAARAHGVRGHAQPQR